MNTVRRDGAALLDRPVADPGAPSPHGVLGEGLVGRLQTDDRWMRAAACRGLTHLFFPPSAERPQARERREATAERLCAGCSVRSTCREFARVNHEYGFWGGESEDERHAAGFRLIAPIGVRAQQVS